MAEEIITVDPEGLRRARVVSQWELGDRTWAEEIVRAYLDPHDPLYEEARDAILGVTPDDD